MWPLVSNEGGAVIVFSCRMLHHANRFSVSVFGEVIHGTGSSGVATIFGRICGAGASKQRNANKGN